MKSANRFKLVMLLSVLMLAALACETGINLSSLEAAENVESASRVVEIDPVGEEVQDSQPTLVSAVETDIVVSPELISQQDALISLYENVSRGVVTILVFSADGGGGTGTGFVIDEEGHIITNFHVIQDAVETHVAFPSGIKVRAEIIGTDTDSDIAVLKVDVSPDDLYPLALGDSTKLKVGQVVIAIGNPFGLSGTMTTGIVSGLGRTLSSINLVGGANFVAGGNVQTDAAINPGNSGGPLLNLDGEVIGINRAIRTFNENADAEPLNSGVGFAIAVNILKRVTPGLIADGFYAYPFLGIGQAPEDADFPIEQMEALGLERAIGSYISNVTVGGPADNAGLRVGDVILAIDDHQVTSFGDLIGYLFTDTSPGDEVLLTVFRNEEEITLTLEIGSR